MWRVQASRNYYLCRFNPLEANFRVYVVVDGARKQLATALVDANPGRWHKLSVRHVGAEITCSLDGRQYLTVRDATISGPRGVGFWTKADAQISFDDLAIENKGD
jgi:hypothetical protein